MASMAAPIAFSSARTEDGGTPRTVGCGTPRTVGCGTPRTVGGGTPRTVGGGTPRTVVPELDRLRQYLKARAPVQERRLPPLPSGLEALDRTLEGGLPRGGITVLSGSTGAGRMTLAARIVAHQTKAGRTAAWIDAKSALYPPALSLAGIDLERLLMVRGSRERAFYAAEQIVSSGSFGVVVATGIDEWVTSSRLRRLQTATESTRTATILVLEPDAAAQVQNADLKLRLSRRAAGIQVEVEKNRSGVVHGRRALLAAV